ncbi:unnamed protein product [Penicillium egyptiacum]|uniref:F-box domain-containing protein n=1 Tax=Penicillium egyptiacum TaxID=1303716 RepID=A0A9W4KCP3_9EURO|nr:unnamed protein product [Penicillium egyptiacum]
MHGSPTSSHLRVFASSNSLQVTYQLSMASPAPSGMATQRPWFFRFPPEMISLIVSFLPNKDVKSLRLTCKALGEITPFSSSRVFLSANSLNIQVFRAVADHPKFRQEITEIIWDDARFVSAPLIWENVHPTIDPQSIDAQIPLKACWEYYLQILNDQTTVIESQDDEKAFLYGLERFPRLKRVTVTPAAHGWLFTPLYETPMIRAFPYGFNYLIPRGWHFDQTEGQVIEPLLWSEVTEEYKELWRGARIALRVLSQVKKHNFSELSFDSKQLHTGINFRIFDQPCEEYNHFAAIIKRPGFRRLHLSLLTSSSGYWAGFQSGYFHQAVSLARELTDIYLSTTFNLGSLSSLGDPPIPLKEVLPIKEWPNLCNLALSRFSVDTSELMDILKLLPSSLRSIELEFIEFPFDESCLIGLLERMREELNWAERDQLKPTVTIAMEGHRR